MGCTGQGWICSIFLFIFVLCAVLGIIFDGMSEPNGDLGIYYGVDACLAKDQSFDISGRGYFDSFVMRGTPAETEQRGSACPATPTAGTDVNITLEEDDGFRFGADYSPVFVLPDSTYALVSFTISDRNGVILPTAIVALGPDENYPWTVESTAITYPTTSPPQSAPAMPPGATAATTQSTGATTQCCSESCSFASDGACDDGGPGAQYSVCSSGQDCTDCGDRCASSGRRLLYSTRGGAAFDAAASDGVAYGAAWGGEGDEAYSVDPGFTPKPGARRVLKGGSSGGSSSYSSGGSYSSSRSSYNSGASRASYISSSRRSSYTGYSGVTTYQSRSYGGYSSYYVGSRHYYMSPRPYYYYYGYHWYYPMTSFIIVSRWGYGCYSCGGYYRSCYQCSGCTRRSECSGGREQSALEVHYDRYELSEETIFPTPGSGDPKWPLTLTIHNFTLFYPRGTSSLPLTTSSTSYLTFATSSGDAFKNIGGALSPIGWIGAIFVAFYIICNRRSLFEDRAQSAPAFRPQQVEMSFQNQQPIGYGRPVQNSCYGQQPTAVAQPMAMGQQVVYPHQGSCYGQQPTMAIAQPYPGQRGSMGQQPMAYPVQGGQQMAMAYPGQQQMPVASYISPPTSPPEEEGDEASAPIGAPNSVDARGKDE